MNNTVGLREYNARVLGRTYQVYAHDRYGALSQAVRLYIKDHPGYTFTMLMSLGSAKLVHPESPGRKTVNYE